MSPEGPAGSRESSQARNSVASTQRSYTSSNPSILTDKASGRDTRRPELDRLLAFVREGDAAVVHSMDRLARNLDDLRRIVRNLTRAVFASNSSRRA
jgi:DNA invertase Pin-like site-specific DNA recombinase